MIKRSDFKAPWWLPTGHFQTIAPLFLPHKPVKIVKEDLDLPDGDFVELAWTETPSENDSRPIVIILHGIEGSVDSHYSKTILNAIKNRGWIGLFMHFRGCGSRPNLKAESYHSGRTDDLAFLIETISQRYKSAPLAAIGFSLGGNVLAKFLGETPQSLLKTGVVICAPLKLSVSAESINKGASRIYREYLLKSLKHHVHIKINNKLISHITVDDLKNIRTLQDFDSYYTAPIHGFKNINDYYESSSGWHYLKSIQTPTLVLQALDDPFINSPIVPGEDEISDYVTYEVSVSGGHIGFVTGKSPLNPNYWFADHVLDFIEEYIFTKEAVPEPEQTSRQLSLRVLLKRLKHLYSQQIKHFLQ